MSSFESILLDALPSDFKGYLLRTDYRIGIQISQIMQDIELSTEDKLYSSYDLLYGEGVPEDADLAYEGLVWFLHCGVVSKEEFTDIEPEEGTDNTSKEETEQSDSSGVDSSFDYDFDAQRIYSAFRRAYSIDLKREKLHWFEFVSLLDDVGECCLTQVIEYRTADTSKMPIEQRRAYRAMKRKYKIPTVESAETVKFTSKALGVGDYSEFQQN